MNPAPSPRTILLVDDDRVFCRTLANALRRRGHEVLMAHDVEEGHAEAEAWKPEAVVVDLRMPEREDKAGHLPVFAGLKLVRSLGQLEVPPAVVVLTGHGSIATAVHAVKLGAVQYLTKPVSTEEVLAAFLGQAPEERLSSAPSLDTVEWEHLQRVLQECDGNVSEAARRLGMHRRSLQRKLARGRTRQ